MPKQIILNRAVVEDDWQLLRVAEGGSAETLDIPAGKVILPLASWQARAQELEARLTAGEIGVWFASDQRPEVLKGQVERFPVIAVDFPKFADGRGYSIAYNLRMRLGFTRQLRAIGDVLRDQMFYMQRVGFDAFEPRADRSIEDALKGLSDFSQTYQNAVDQKAPLFARVKREFNLASSAPGMTFGDGAGI